MKSMFRHTSYLETRPAGGWEPALTVLLAIKTRKTAARREAKIDNIDLNGILRSSARFPRLRLEMLWTITLIVTQVHSSMVHSSRLTDEN